MRRKKHKHTRKTVAFYKVHYGFKEPFKVCVVACVAMWVALAERGEGATSSWRARHPSESCRAQVLLDGNFLHATLQSK